MSRYADLDRARQEHILVNQHANVLMLIALAEATKQPIEYWVEHITGLANTHVDHCDDAAIDAVIAQLDSRYQEP